MSTDRDTTRIVRSWLEEGRTTLPDWIRDDVFDRLPATPQRRSSGTAWRFLTMPTAAKTAIAAAAVILVAIGAMAFLQRPTGPAATTTQSPTTPPTAGPSVAIEQLPTTGPIEAGTYRVASTPVIITLPPGWDVVDGNDIRKNRDLPTEVTLNFWRPDIAVYADACLSDAPPPVIGPTADDLLAALRAQDSSDVSEPVAVRIGDVPAKRLVVSPPEGIDPISCDEDLFHIWSGFVGDGNHFGLIKPEEIYIAEGASGRVVFRKASEPDATAADLAELDRIMESMVIEP